MPRRQPHTPYKPAQREISTPLAHDLRYKIPWERSMLSGTPWPCGKMHFVASQTHKRNVMWPAVLAQGKNCNEDRKKHCGYVCEGGFAVFRLKAGTLDEHRRS